MNNLCPGCNTAYSVQPQHVGRRITCRKCGAGLVVEQDGLRMTSPPPPPAPPEDDAADVPAIVDEAPARIVRAQRSWRLSESVATWSRANRDGLFTTLFAAGTMAVIVFVFLPVIDQAKVARAQIRVREEGGDTVTRINPASKSLEQAQKELHDVEAAAQFARYWYDWGMLFGFLLLAAGSLGFLASPSSPIKRVLGCIILAGQLLLVFLTIVIGRSLR